MSTDGAVQALLDGVTNPVRRRDAETLLELMGRVTGETASLRGASIVGFGTYHYRYDSGREGDAPAASFSPRKAATTHRARTTIGDAARADRVRASP